MESGDKVLHEGVVRTIYSVYSETMVSLCLIGYDDVEEDYQTPINELTKL